MRERNEHLQEQHLDMMIHLAFKAEEDDAIQKILGQHRINGRIHIGGHVFCENQQDAPCFCSQGRTDSSCQAGPVSQNQIR